MTQTPVRPRGRNRTAADPQPVPRDGAADVEEGRRLVASARRNSSRIPYPASGPFPVGADYLKDFKAAWAISAAGGLLGADRFYLGRPVSGALKLLTLGGAGLWWAGDMFSLAAGTAVNGRGHPMAGRLSHRLAATAASTVLAATGFAMAIPPVLDALPDPSALKAQVEGLVEARPEPPAPPSWKTVATLSGEASGETESFTVTGNAVRYRYSISGPGYVYLLPAGADVLADGIEPVAITEEGESGTLTSALDPGDYVFAVQSGSTTWSFDVEQYDGDVVVDPGL